MSHGRPVRPAKYGHGEASMEFMDRQEVLKMLRATFQSTTYEPPVLPATAIELLALSRSPKVEFPEVASLLQRDPLVAAKVLKIAQSAMYSRGTPVTSLQEAVVRLGLETVANVFLQVSMNMRVFRAPGYGDVMTELRRHSAMTAEVARIVCRKTSVYDEYAFLCGLLHDVGVAAGAAVIGASAPFGVAWPAVMDAHAEAGRSLCLAWKLPPDVALVVGTHHGAAMGQMHHPVACVIAIADWISTHLGFALEGEPSDAEPTAELKALGIGAASLADIMNDAKKAGVRVDAS